MGEVTGPVAPWSFPVGGMVSRTGLIALPADSPWNVRSRWGPDFGRANREFARAAEECIRALGDGWGTLNGDDAPTLELHAVISDTAAPESPAEWDGAPPVYSVREVQS